MAETVIGCQNNETDGLWYVEKSGWKSDESERTIIGNEYNLTILL